MTEFDPKTAAAALMKKESPESLGEFAAAATEAGYSDPQFAMMWKAHIAALSEPEYRKACGLPARY
ncbi:MAG: hypothetical protein ABJN42_21640 [Roseibium sp.]|uniref:hypothetical protein n=1 Tax=Roseibium sp. TaxID=1936156 RepID=UPI0032970446